MNSLQYFDALHIRRFAFSTLCIFDALHIRRFAYSTPCDSTAFNLVKVKILYAKYTYSRAFCTCFEAFSEFTVVKLKIRTLFGAEIKSIHSI